jgi:hypothetical protein
MAGIIAAGLVVCAATLAALVWRGGQDSAGAPPPGPPAVRPAADFRVV